ncbi:Uncaracterized surface protein containing fasciclin (FAS1) repeats [Hymenobacter gelipurpurascens]|uniref:Uncaracterized surface protein containing fasciclin (FAS1) repeats n=1 Tax=Hymenobacter gelipurpurascens TaxID=89968 RepID=A0A212T4I4_9BACT|nr:fasciclin domain-containing protein [Hymenobacter gelipurpurascens]SNC60919.1 Uncaracterized surface protein containing fasciclin (FAS1) repeats [Hymenobacter gelipurpurascens]
MSYPISALLPLWRRLSFLLIALLGFAASSCDDDDDTMPADTQQNIVQVAQSNPDFSILVAAVTKADLAATLSGTGPFTVLAPTNAAFAQLGAPFNSAASINAIPAGDPQIATLRNILLYHVLAGRVAAADFPSGASAQLTQKPASASGVNDNTVYVSKTGTTVRLNGSTSVVTADVAASNGIIHAIDRVLMPPTGKISDIVVASAAASPAQFTLLLQALQRPAAAALLTAAANPSSNLTVFAPTDAAFQALLTQLNLTSLSQVPDATLVAVLQLHIVGSRAFSSDLASGPVTTLGGPVTVGVNGSSVTVRGNGNGTNNANVTTANILASNGVIHVIDRVLLP